MALQKRGEVLEGQMQQVIRVLDRVVTNQEKLDNVLAILAESHIKTQEQMRETDQRMRETDERLTERMRELDERLSARIDKLVSGIGEFIRLQSDSKPN